MQEENSLTVVTSDVRTALQIAKHMRQTDTKFNRTEWKLQCTDLMMVLADAQIHLYRLEKLFSEKEKEILNLKERLDDKSEHSLLANQQNILPATRLHE